MDTLLLALRVLLSLGAVLALLWYAQRRFAKRGVAKGKPKNPVSVVGRQGIGAKASVVVVDVEGRRLVLGVTEQNVSVLHEEVRPAEPLTLAAPDHNSPTTIQAVQGVGASATTGGSATTGAPVADLALRRPRNNRSQGPLAGSILSPETWRQTAAALRQVR